MRTCAHARRLLSAAPGPARAAPQPRRGRPGLGQGPAVQTPQESQSPCCHARSEKARMARPPGRQGARARRARRGHQCCPQSPSSCPRCARTAGGRPCSMTCTGSWRPRAACAGQGRVRPGSTRACMGAAEPPCHVPTSCMRHRPCHRCHCCRLQAARPAQARKHCATQHCARDAWGPCNTACTQPSRAGAAARHGRAGRGRRAGPRTCRSST